MEYGVGKPKQDALKSRMESLSINESDIDEHFIRASKKGGQRVNKASVCVYLKHKPTGIEVKCQKERSRAVNRYYARKILTDKIESLINGRRSARQKEIEKIRRRKRRRSRRAKEKMLRKKKEQSEKKKLRKPPKVNDY